MYRPEVGSQTVAYMNRPAAGQIFKKYRQKSRREYEKKNLADFRDIFKKNKFGSYKHILRLNKDTRPIRF
jgi:hypothetical protein